MTTTTTYEQTNIIIVNGNKMSIKEWKLLLRQTNVTKTKKAYKQVTAISLLPDEIKALMKNAKVINSLEAYYNNGYRQWGNVCKDVINFKGIASPFAKFKIELNKTNELINEINVIAKRNSKYVYSYVRKLSWQIEDLQTAVKNLCNGIDKSDILYSVFADSECINGKGKRLGLKLLKSKAVNAIDELGFIAKELNRIADEY